jgi:hypothetical protein
MITFSSGSLGNEQGGTQGAPSLDGTQLFIHMMGSEIYVLTRVHDYNNPKSTLKGKESLDPRNSLHIEKPTGDSMSHISKGVYKRSSHNPNARAMMNYSIVDDLAQTPCVMLALEVL